jgi:hypothetical protein
MLHMSVDTTPQQIGQRLDDERRKGLLGTQTRIPAGGQIGEQQWLTLGEDELKSRHANRQADWLAHRSNTRLNDESLD